MQNTRITAATEDLGDQYAYDGAGRLVSVLRGVPTAQIGTAMATNITNNDYDDLVEYHYDQTGNRLTLEVDGTNEVTYAHNTVNEMTTEGSSTLAYDSNGNFEGASNTYKYNWQNQLATYTFGPATFTWHHDAFGRTVQQDRTTSTASARRYYDGVNTIEAVSFESTTGVETLQKTWVFGDRPDEVLMYIDVTASPDDEYYAHADRLGSVMLMVDDTGAIQESYRFTEWGEHTILDDTFTALSFGANSPIKNPYLYTGQRWARTAEGSTGGSGMTWLDYKARHYRADAGRFVQRDPMGYVDGANEYVYGALNPVNNTDPWGRQTAPTPPKRFGQPRVPGGGVPPLLEAPAVAPPGPMGPPLPDPCQPRKTTGMSQGVLCDCSTCGSDLCMQLTSEVISKVNSGVLPASTADGSEIKCEKPPAGEIGEHDWNELAGFNYGKSIYLNMDAMYFSWCNFPGGGGNSMNKAQFTMWHEYGHMLGAEDSILGEMQAWNYACAVTYGYEDMCPSCVYEDVIPDGQYNPAVIPEFPPGVYQ